tara:strand:- start:8 stop:208 length:201 start_codon:yes stop_codon:yes gene_type:complete
MTETFPCVLLIGDILTGYDFIGPFPNWAAAQEYADDQYDPYTIIDLSEPEYPEVEWVEDEDEEEGT